MNSSHLISTRTHTHAHAGCQDGAGDGQVLGSAWYPRSPQHADSAGVEAAVGLASRGEAVVLAGLGAGLCHGLLWGVWGLGRPRGRAPEELRPSEDAVCGQSPAATCRPA